MKLLPLACSPFPILTRILFQQSLISGKLEQEIEHLEGRANKAFEKLALGTDFRRHVEWVVKGSSGTAIEVIAVAERAGTVRCRLRLESQQEP